MLNETAIVSPSPSFLDLIVRSFPPFLISILLVFTAIESSSQITLTQLPSGGNKKASVSERIGITDVTIDYDRPAVNGREGKIWGEVVHYGFADLGYGTSKAAPWRAGSPG